MPGSRINTRKFVLLLFLEKRSNNGETVENLENLIQETRKDIEKLKKNEEKVGKRELQTKFAKPYNALRQKIKAETNDLLYYLLIGCLPAAEGDGENEGFLLFVSECQRIINEEKEAGTFKRIGRAIFLRHDLDAALTIGYDVLEPRILYEAYAHYWLQRCREYKGRWWNDIICMWWNPDHGQWERKSDGMVMWQSGLPPTMELVSKKYESLRNGMKEVIGNG